MKRLNLVLLASLLTSYFSLVPSARADITISSAGDALVKTASVVLTNAQIKALAVDGSNRPVALVPAPAANQMIVPIQVMFVPYFAEAYGNINIGSILFITQLGGSDAMLSTLPEPVNFQVSNVLNTQRKPTVAGLNQWAHGTTFGFTFNANIATYKGLPLSLALWNNIAGDLTGGDPANKLLVEVWYTITSPDVPNPPPIPPPRAITSQVLGSLRNDFSGNLGFAFVPSANITVLALGRWVVSGNSGIHTLSLRDASNNVLASVTVNTSGATSGDYVFSNLGTPVSLSSGTTYLMYSGETNGADTWYNNNTTVASSSDISVTGPSYDGNIITNANSSFIPVNFKYTKP